MTPSSQEHLGIGVNSKSACHSLTFYTSPLTDPLWKIQLPHPDTVWVWEAPSRLLGFLRGGWEQWKSKWLSVQGMTSCPLPPPHFLPQQPPEDIKALAWNRQVQHILSSAHPSGKAVVWDLRKNEPIIKVSDHSNRVSREGRIQAQALASFSCLDFRAALPQASVLLPAVALAGSSLLADFRLRLNA